MAVPVWELAEAHQYWTGEGPGWQLVFRKPDGTIHLHTFPRVAVVDRAALYGLDPDTDFVLILEILVHENDAPDPEHWPDGWPPDPAIALGHTREAPARQGRHGPGGQPGRRTVGVGALTAPDAATARAVHQARIALVKDRLQRLDLTSHMEGVAAVQSQAAVTAAEVAERAAAVGVVREQVRGEAAAGGAVREGRP